MSKLYVIDKSNLNEQLESALYMLCYTGECDTRELLRLLNSDDFPGAWSVFESDAPGLPERTRELIMMGHAFEDGFCLDGCYLVAEHNGAIAWGSKH